MDNLRKIFTVLMISIIAFSIFNSTVLAEGASDSVPDSDQVIEKINDEKINTLEDSSEMKAFQEETDQRGTLKVPEDETPGTFIPRILEVEKITDKSDYIAGISESGSIVTIKVDSTNLGTATVGKDGRFSVAIPLQKAGTKLTLIAADGAGNMSEPIEIIVQGVKIEEANTSRLGHLKRSDVKIYPELGNTSSVITADKSYTNTVYYIKKEGILNGQKYYLLSRNPSSTKGLVGWAKAEDLSTQPHLSVDKQNKSFYLKGTGSAYTKAWGGKKDLAFSNLSSLKNKKFNVRLTEKAGDSVWYRGTLDGKMVWIHANHVTGLKESKTSLLGHIGSSSVKIYPEIGNASNSITAGTTYTNAVYYIKKEGVLNGQKYYLLSRNPSSTKGIVGWVKAEDVSTQRHLSVDKQKKSFYLKGTGSAYTKAWGGKKDLAFSNLSSLKDKKFNVRLTEKAGDSVWYRGTLDGKMVWIHANHVTGLKESKTSLLGHIGSSSVKIYPEIGNTSSVITAGKTYTNAVYYIKKEGVLNGQKYYLLSRNPSSTTGIVGWVKAKDVSTQRHLSVDKQKKSFYLKGTGSAYTKAWGGKKDLAFSNLSSLKNKKFNVHLTEKAGNSVWYRGTLNGENVWIHQSYLSHTSLIADKYPAPSSKTPGHYVDGVLIVNKKYALPSNYNPGINTTAQKGVNAMVADAKKQGVYLQLISTFRSYSYQSNLYNRYVRSHGKAAADRFSARPGHSEHQTGLAFDFGGTNQTHWLEQSFEGTKEGKWLLANAHKYGFILRYPKGKENITGYIYEPWHYRYVGSKKAAEIKNSKLTMEEYFKVSGK